jgi:hypothetical protein
MKEMFGGILIAMGILIAGLSGLCSAAFFLMAMGGGGGDIAAATGVIMVVGGLPFAFGLALFFGGKALIRTAKRTDRGEG